MQTFSLAERPDLLGAFWSIPDDWPTFMLQDPTSDRAYEAAVTGFPQLHLVVMDGDVAVARLHAVPFSASVDSLPPRGWDWALQRAEWPVLTARRGMCFPQPLFLRCKDGSCRRILKLQPAAHPVGNLRQTPVLSAPEYPQSLRDPQSNKSEPPRPPPCWLQQ